MKAANTQAVRSLWETINANAAGTPEYNAAHAKLAGISQTLMRQMKSFQYRQMQLQQQQKQMQQVQQQGQGQAQGKSEDAQPPQVPPQLPQQPQQPRQPLGATQFQQLLPQIQAKVNGLSFVYPPKVDKAQAEAWLNDAKLRYGIALQKQELGKAKLNELRQAYQQRQSAGNLTPEEMQDFKNRQVAANKLFQEGSEFFIKFKEQQDSFRVGQSQAQTQTQSQPQQAPQQQTSNAQQNRPVVGGPAPTVPQQQQQPQGPIVKTEPGLPDGPRPPAQASTNGPSPYTITSAVAARNQAGQTIMSPATSQAGQPTSQPPQITGQPQQSTAQNPLPQSQPLFPQHPSQTESSSTPLSTTSTQNIAGHPQGPPRPLSQEAAFQQSAQNYSNSTQQQTPIQQQPQQQPQPQPQQPQPQQQQQQQPQQPQPQPQQQQQQPHPPNTHSHPQGYTHNRTDSSSRSVHMAIPKTLNVKPPEPVSMGPARPTLSGGPSHGAMGVMSQPAIQKHPGYVLEGEGQHVLSKKMLDVLVKQVTGGGEGQGLTPDAEEVLFLFYYYLHSISTNVTSPKLYPPSLFLSHTPL